MQSSYAWRVGTWGPSEVGVVAVPERVRRWRTQFGNVATPLLLSPVPVVVDAYSRLRAVAAVAAVVASVSVSELGRGRTYRTSHTP